MPESITDAAAPQDHYIWLIPVDTRASQCLHVCIKPHDGQPDLHVVVSDYECLHGHRASHLMAKMVQGAESLYHIDVEEPPLCDVLRALEFMHADVPALDLARCSALTYARTAHFLDMRRLAEDVIARASEVLLAMDSPEPDPEEGAAVASDQRGRSSAHSSDECATTSTSTSLKSGEWDTKNSTTTRSSCRGSSSSRVRFHDERGVMSPWDAIAVLTLLGDPQQALQLVSLKKWYQRDSRLFEHPDLFSSCHFFGPRKFADMVKMMNEHHAMLRIASQARSSERVLVYSAVASSLLADLRAVLLSYVGKQVVARRGSRPGSSPSSALSSVTVTGSVVNSFIEKERAYVVVEWHVCASRSVISLREFVQSGHYRVLEGSGGRAARSSSCAAESKSRGAMKYC